MLKNHLWDSVTISPINDNMYLFEAYVNEKDLNFISSLLSKMGKHIKVVSPKPLIQRLINELEEISAMYQNS